MPAVAIHSARPTPLAALLNPVHLATTLWRHRDLTWQFTKRYFQARYRGTHLGTLWAVLNPLLMLAVYTFLFHYVFEARFGNDPSQTRGRYAVILFGGISVYAIFSETVVRSCGLVLDQPNLVTKVVFPLEVLPVAGLGATLLFSLFSLGLTLLGTWVFFGAIPWTAVLLPLVILPAAALALGLSWFLASLTVFVRDAANLVVIVVSQVLLFLTPIFYRIENLPEDVRWLAELNPMAGVVESARRVAILGQLPEWASLGWSMLAGLGGMVLGYAWFVKSKRGFADVL
jgi:lipopolysaccharide transport system permease protein